MLLEDIISFIISPPPASWLLTLKVVFIAASSLFLLFIILLVLNTSWLEIRFLRNISEFLTYRPYGLRKSTSQWLKIVSRLESGLESEYKLAVIEADSLFDEVLKNMGYKGESLGERLDKVSPDVISNLQEINFAHKVRNSIVHDPDYHLSYEDAKKILDIFGKTLTELDVL